MTMHSKTENSSMMFITGLLLGATLAALFTPRKGEEMRDSIKRKLSDIKESAKDTALDVGQKVEDKARDTKEKLQKSKNKDNDNIPPMSL